GAWPSEADGGLGRSLMRTFASQAGAEQDIEVNDQGCRVTLARQPSAA
ncbi:MAG: histidine kinase, partial [Citromicrobium sp.]|nr:histidine kinase [Citromicrobium sp.]